MSGSQKSLQDIYDEGSKRLDASEQAQRQTLQDSGAQGAEDLGRIESSMMTKMDVSLADLEAEIHAYLDKAVESINAVVSSEVEENRKFLERLQDALKLSCQSLSEDVKQLRESMVQRFNASAEHCMTLQRRELDQGIGRLKSDAGGSASHLKELTQLANTGFNSRASMHVLQVLDKSAKAPAEYFVEFSRHAISIDKRINDCIQLLTSRSKEIISDISAGGAEVQMSLDQVVQELAVQIEEVYRQSDSILRRHCEDALSAALLHQEELSTKLTSDILESNQSSGSGLSEKSQALKTDTERLLDQVKQLLLDVDFGVRQNCGTLSETFEQSLQERLEDARNHNQLVADERSQLMERIGGDLQQIESNFESRLSELAQKYQARLSSVCVDAELAIVSAHDSCAAEFKSLSSQQQQSIEEKTQQLLRDIDRLSQQAILNIKTAAGENGAVQSQGQSAPKGSELEISEGNGTNNPFGDFGDLKL